jgi:hypothetical protein
MPHWLSDLLETLETGASLLTKGADALERQRSRNQSANDITSTTEPVGGAATAAGSTEQKTRLARFLERHFLGSLFIGYVTFILAFLGWSRLGAIITAYVAILVITIHMLWEERTVYHGIADIAFRLFFWSVMAFVYLGMFITPIWFVDGIVKLLK